MSDFMDVGQFHENERTGKWRFQKLGYAKPNSKGGWDINLDALPINGKFGVRICMMPQRDDRQDHSKEPQRGGGGRFPDDEIPFAPQVK